MAETSEDPVLRERIQRLLHRGDIGTDRVRSRASAYVYGTVLALAALLETGAGDVRSGYALGVLLVTTATTYLAHIFAHDIGGRIGRTEREHRSEVRAEIRDALPIATSGLVPAVPMLVGLLGWWSPTVAQVVAIVLVLLRLGGTGATVGYLTGRSAAFAWWSGLALAVAGALIATLKVVFLH